MYNFNTAGEFLSNGKWQSYTLTGSAPNYAEAYKLAHKFMRKYVTRKSFVKIMLAGA